MGSTLADRQGKLHGGRVTYRELRRKLELDRVVLHVL